MYLRGGIMNINKAYETNFQIKRLVGGFIFFPYQLSLGLSLRYFERSPAIRTYFLCFKFWANYERKPDAVIVNLAKAFMGRYGITEIEEE